MFLEERHQRILQLLDDEGRVTVSDLANRFDVTDDCIRKDLKQLSAEGKCRRVYGRATKATTPAIRKVSGRLRQFTEEKQAVARKAVGLIKPGYTVFLDISTTTLQLARLIAQNGTPCTVVSPMVGILTLLADAPQVTAVCPGGTLHTELDGFVGSLALENLENFRFELAYIGAYGIDVEANEVTTCDMEDGLLKASAIRHTAHSYLVSEVRKVGVFGSYRYAKLDDFDALICDDAESAEAGLVRAAGLEVR